MPALRTLVPELNSSLRLRLRIQAGHRRRGATGRPQERRRGDWDGGAADHHRGRVTESGIRSSDLRRSCRCVRSLSPSLWNRLVGACPWMVVRDSWTAGAYGRCGYRGQRTLRKDASCLTTHAMRGARGRKDRRMADKRCPRCGLWCAGTARRCDCGHVFQPGSPRPAAEAVRAAPPRPRRKPGDKRCPHCALWCAGDATRCDCGYDFTTGKQGPGAGGDAWTPDPFARGCIEWILGDAFWRVALAAFGVAGMVCNVMVPNPDASWRVAVLLALLGLFAFGVVYGLWRRRQRAPR